jgi:hypothetical protein
MRIGRLTVKWGKDRSGIWDPMIQTRTSMIIRSLLTDRKSEFYQMAGAVVRDQTEVFLSEREFSIEAAVIAPLIEAALIDKESDLRKGIIRVVRGVAKDFLGDKFEAEQAAARTECVDGWSDHAFNADGLCVRCLGMEPGRTCQSYGAAGEVRPHDFGPHGDTRWCCRCKVDNPKITRAWTEQANPDGAGPFKLPTRSRIIRETEHPGFFDKQNQIALAKESEEPGS